MRLRTINQVWKLKQKSYLNNCLLMRRVLKSTSCRFRNKRKKSTSCKKTRLFLNKIIRNCKRLLQEKEKKRKNSKAFRKRMLKILIARCNWKFKLRNWSLNWLNANKALLHSSKRSSNRMKKFQNCKKTNSFLNKTTKNFRK